MPRGSCRTEIQGDRRARGADVVAGPLPLQAGKCTGAGLGLTIAERIACLHGGALSLANREGGGLMVTVALPVR